MRISDSDSSAAEDVVSSVGKVAKKWGWRAAVGALALYGAMDSWFTIDQTELGVRCHLGMRI